MNNESLIETLNKILGIINSGKTSGNSAEEMLGKIEHYIRGIILNKHKKAE
jgi:hypothetical protein